jgi:hypothetical protein
MPPDETFELIRDNRGRVLAAYVHVRSGHGGTELAAMFKIPTGTAYEWLRWFDRLPEGETKRAARRSNLGRHGPDAAGRCGREPYWLIRYSQVT